MKVIDVDALNEKLERLAIQRIKGDDGCDVLTVSLADVLRMIDSLSTIELEATFADRMSRKLDALGLPVREYNCLRRYGIDTIADLYKVKQDGMLPKVRNLGKRSAERIEKVLDEFIGVKPELGTNLAEVGTDCISRQQAIDATWQDTGYTDPFNVMTAIRDRIKQLPPIQPVSSSEFPNSSNTDTISRQAAIEAVQNRHIMLNKEKVLLIHDLEKLPSAASQHKVRFSDADHVWIDGKQYISLQRFGEAVKDAQPQIIRCKDCKHWIPYDWMFSDVWQSKNIADYPEDDIGCDCCEMAMKANDFCSRAERRKE